MKTKLKLYFFILTLLLVPKLQAQVVFNKIIEDTIGHITNSVVALDSGYVFLSGTGNEYGVRSFALTYVNEVGDKQWKHIYGDSVVEYWDGWDGNLKKNDNGYYLGSGIVNTNTGDYGIHLSNFDAQFNLADQNIMCYDSIDKRAFNTKISSDSCYYITGSILCEDIEQVKLMLLKADNSGNYIWHKSYSGEYTYGLKIIETTMHNILVGGARSLPIGNNNRKWYFLKTDTAGNIIWEQAYGRNNYNNGRVSGLIETQDSNYLACGIYPAASYGSETLYDGCLRKIDTAGELLWEKHYRNYSKYSDGDITLRESFNNLISDSAGNLYVLSNTYGSKPFYRGSLIKLNKNGQILYKRYYYAIDEYSNEQFLVDIKPTIDKGFVLAGYGVSYDWYGYDPPQQAWLVKTDSLGMDGLSNTEPDALQLEVDFPLTACNNDTIQISVEIAGKSAPYTLEFSTGQVTDSIYYPACFVPQEIGLDTLELEYLGSPYLIDTIREATITNHEWGYCIAKPVDFYTPADAGYLNLYVTLTDAYGESITLADGLMITDCPTTLTEIESASHFSFYPNPATNKLHLEIPNLTHPQQAEIYDASGKLVLSQEISSKITRIDIRMLSPGNYILKINGKSESFTVVK
jgi:hypothetical protein